MSIFSFFSKSTTGKVTQAVNIAALVAALYAKMQDPEAIAEHGLDILVHWSTALALREDAPAIELAGSAMTNLFRLGALYSAATGGCSSVPMATLTIDTGLHLWNTFYSLLKDADEIHASSTEPSIQPS